jgi:hypothetical protein
MLAAVEREQRGAGEVWRAYQKVSGTPSVLPFPFPLCSFPASRLISFSLPFSFSMWCNADLPYITPPTHLIQRADKDKATLARLGTLPHDLLRTCRRARRSTCRIRCLAISYRG